MNCMSINEVLRGGGGGGGGGGQVFSAGVLSGVVGFFFF